MRSSAADPDAAVPELWHAARQETGPQRTVPGVIGACSENKGLAGSILTVIGVADRLLRRVAMVTTS